MTNPGETLELRLDRLESRAAIGQLAIRYALAIDGRDLDEWVGLFIPDVQVGRSAYGRAALRDYIEPRLRSFGRSMHQICGHRIDLDLNDPDAASGLVYCRAEHEVGDRWIIMAICYFDTYSRVDGDWFFRRRKERHWYSVDVNEHPQSVEFDSWKRERPADLPDAFPNWSAFWGESTSGITT
jgi:hypothetical protein